MKELETKRKDREKYREDGELEKVARRELDTAMYTLFKCSIL
jgi:hypothetical protein